MYSGKPAASLVVSELVIENGLGQPQGRRRLDAAGMQAVEASAERIAGLVDELLDKRWNHLIGEYDDFGMDSTSHLESPPVPVTGTCSCGSGIPVQVLEVEGQQMEFIALPLIFEQFRQAGKAPSSAPSNEIMEEVKIYNPIPPESQPATTEAILEAYSKFLETRTQS